MKVDELRAHHLLGFEVAQQHLVEIHGLRDAVRTAEEQHLGSRNEGHLGQGVHTPRLQIGEAMVSVSSRLAPI
ncbi:hypothetical protein [Trinickia dinghuensis]|uniref:hypothetical protein n=1 Tax=Trinickia dinghuensis TaxID=2291023 RepID=UPI001C695CA4|nr:hypothetical protein [Trinickia dinghuensis]